MNLCEQQRHKYRKIRNSRAPSASSTRENRQLIGARGAPPSELLHSGKMETADSKLIKICAVCCKREQGTPDVPVRPEFISSNPLMRCSKCKSAFYCSQDCQRRAWETHKKPCTELATKGLIACVLLHSGKGLYEQVYLSADDPRFDAAFASPVMQVGGGTDMVFLNRLRSSTSTSIII